MNPRVADRKTWSKFGQSVKDAKGPATDTTSVGENIIFRPSVNWRKDEKDAGADAGKKALQEQLKDKQVKCRICSGEHFTARCPYKDTMAPVGEAAPSADVAAGMPSDADAGPAGKKGSYVPPALRGGAAGAGERMGGSKYGERDDLATLRVTNVSCRLLIIKGHIHILTFMNRFPSWQRRANFATCSSASVASQECSWPRTGRRAWPRVSHSSASQIGAMLSRHATRWMVSVSST